MDLSFVHKSRLPESNPTGPPGEDTEHEEGQRKDPRGTLTF